MADLQKMTSEARAAGVTLLALAFDAYAVLNPGAGLQPVASTTVGGLQAAYAVFSGAAVFNKNVAEAVEEAAQTLHGSPGAEETIIGLRENPELWRSRQTLAYRLIMEAGRHPERAMRLVLGRAAARMILSNIDPLDAFEIAEALARMTALDYAVLDVLRFDPAVPEQLPRRPIATKVAFRDQSHGASLKWIKDRLPAAFDAVDVLRVQRVGVRLDGLGVTAGFDFDSEFKTTPFGESLLEITTPSGTALRP
jgi:hypothetical protein